MMESFKIGDIVYCEKWIGIKNHKMIGEVKHLGIIDGKLKFYRVYVNRELHNEYFGVEEPLSTSYNLFLNRRNETIKTPKAFLRSKALSKILA